MNTYKKLVLVGTSHISKDSIKEVKETILKYKPDIVAIELDRLRMMNLLSQKRKISLRDIRRVGFKGFLFAVIGYWIEKKLGEIVNVKPGSEMLMAINIARNTKSKVALIDQDIRITLRKLSKRITLKEKLRFGSDIIKSFFVKTKIDFDLRKVPSQTLINKLTKQLKERYPTVYEVLISERNFIIAKNLYLLMQKDYTIVAVIGAGHEKSVINIIKDLEKNV